MGLPFEPILLSRRKFLSSRPSEVDGPVFMLVVELNK